MGVCMCITKSAGNLRLMLGARQRAPPNMAGYLRCSAPQATLIMRRELGASWSGRSTSRTVCGSRSAEMRGVCHRNEDTFSA